MDKFLDQELLEYAASGIYPFHMPGHKRQPMGDFLPEEIDITEIDGFDNLHHAEGLLKEGQERLARLFGAWESCYLVNGSTGGLLAAISACVSWGGRLLIGRNCHKAVYHAAYLRHARLDYLYPEATDFGIQGGISPGQVEEMLKKFPDVEAVVITSPTYDGVVSDIAAIAQVVHERNLPLIVDEAHGAHFGFSQGFPQKAIACGADLCIESLHKTLPAYTQTAVLHGMHPEAKRYDWELVKRYLSIYQSSSPSYVLMAGLDRCVRLLKEDILRYQEEKRAAGSGQGKAALRLDQQSRLRRFEHRLFAFYQQCRSLQYIEVFPYLDPAMTDALLGIHQKDNGKILISAGKIGWSGQALYDLLLQRYRLQLEMAAGHYVTAIATMMDTGEGFDRLFAALKELDEEAEGSEKASLLAASGKDVALGTDFSKTGGFPGERRKVWASLYEPRERRMELTEAMDSPREMILPEEAVGRIAAEFVCLYPPGIPVLVPGEAIEDKVISGLLTCLDAGMEVLGIREGRICVVQKEKLYNAGKNRYTGMQRTEIDC